MKKLDVDVVPEDLVRKIADAKDQIEYQDFRGRLVVFMNPVDHPSLTEVIGVPVTRTQLVDEGRAIVMNASRPEERAEVMAAAYAVMVPPPWCPLCGSAHDLLQHTGPVIPKHEIRGILDHIGGDCG